MKESLLRLAGSWKDDPDLPLLASSLTHLDNADPPW